MKKKANTYRTVGHLIYIDISTRKYPDAVAIIDRADFNLILDGNGRWFAQSVGSNQIYACRHEPVAPYKTKIIYMHKVICREKLVDHKDGNGCNNTRLNLRRSSKSLNGHNSAGRVHHRISKFKGVGFRKDTRCWTARIRINGEKHNLGCFSTELMAAKAYDKAATRMLGEYARTNLGG